MSCQAADESQGAQVTHTHTHKPEAPVNVHGGICTHTRPNSNPRVRLSVFCCTYKHTRALFERATNGKQCPACPHPEQSRSHRVETHREITESNKLHRPILAVPRRAHHRARARMRPPSMRAQAPGHPWRRLQSESLSEVTCHCGSCSNNVLSVPPQPEGQCVEATEHGHDVADRQEAEAKRRRHL